MLCNSDDLTTFIDRFYRLKRSSYTLNAKIKLATLIVLMWQPISTGYLYTIITNNLILTIALSPYAVKHVPVNIDICLDRSYSTNTLADAH